MCRGPCAPSDTAQGRRYTARAVAGDRARSPTREHARATRREGLQSLSTGSDCVRGKEHQPRRVRRTPRRSGTAPTRAKVHRDARRERRWREHDDTGDNVPHAQQRVALRGKTRESAQCASKGSDGSAPTSFCSRALRRAICVPAPQRECEQSLLGCRRRDNAREAGLAKPAGVARSLSGPTRLRRRLAHAVTDFEPAEGR